jgi:23S rRNA (cytosine1962-C5)-methyltransferase
MKNLSIRKERLGPILGRHPWVFSGALNFIPDGLEPGESVKLIDETGAFVAQGYFNSYSQIAMRIWSYEENELVDNKFFKKRIEMARDLREKYLDSKSTNAYRLINSENDFLPGLIVDRYADYLVLQFHTQGIERWKDTIIENLVKIFKPKGIFERSDTNSRKNENPANTKRELYGEIPDQIEIMENGYKFFVDIKAGQKTGFFLDQRDKRAALAKYSTGKNVLNTFSYSGGFSVYALAGGAEKVTSIDISEKAIELAKENIKLNNLDPAKCEFIVGDVKKYLTDLEKDRFDVIVLDPPAFIKDRRKIKEGIKGYRFINEAAMRALPSGGILMTCSCSAHLSLNDFRYLLSEAGGRAKRSLQIIETFTHGIDHPELVPFTEGEYLKVFVLRII